MNLSEVKQVYFLGIGGIGMSALARYFHSKRKKVCGYDKTPTTLTDELIAEGIAVHFEDHVAGIDPQIISNPGETLVVITPAVPKDHSELLYFRKNNFVIMKRSEVLGMITRDSFTIAVAGTHGKTTTSSMIAHLLKHSGIDCTAFLGGVTKNYNSNLLLPNDSANNIVVVEADEYDRSFLTLHPDVAVITSMDADHLDIYGSAEYMNESYCLFASQVKQNGLLIHKQGLDLKGIIAGKKSYSLKTEADFFGKNIEVKNHRFYFDWSDHSSQISNISSTMPGRHNVENAIAAISIGKQLKIGDEQIIAAMQSFKGVKRRFDYQVQSDRFVYIDDYAHHPEELKACILAAKELYPGWSVCGLFQPHLYSRTRDFVDGFASSLSLLDELYLLDIYPARELPIEGVTSQIIFDKVTTIKKTCHKDALPAELKNKKSGVVLTLGAGDIDQLVEPLRKQFTLNTLK